MTYSDNPIRRYREAHPENVVWAPETGWADSEATEAEEEAEEAREAVWDAYDILAFISGYEEAADSDYYPGQEEEGIEAIGWHPETMKQFSDDCYSFASENVVDLVASGLGARRAGMDFWLTRNRHGAGFWDEGYRESAEANEALQRLTDASHAYGPAELYVGEDGWIFHV